MSQTSRLCLLAGAAICAVGGQAIADVPAKQGQAWSNADEVRALVSEVMADSETRSSLLQSGGMAGHDGKHFYMGSADGNFRLDVSGQIQFRYYLNFRDEQNDDAVDPDEDDFESGFQTRRTKIFFEGHVFDPNLFFRLNGNFNTSSPSDPGTPGATSTSDGSFDLEDAYVGYRWDNGLSVKWGQFKLPFLREESISSAYQLAADRSLVNEVFNQGRSQGIQLTWEAEDWRVMGAFSDGFGSVNSEFGSARAVSGTGFFVTPTGVSGGESDYAITGRFEYKFAGNWDQFVDFTSMPGSDFGAMVGVAAHYEGGNGDEDGDAGGVPPDFASDYNYSSATVDVSLEGDGWNFYLAGVGAWSDFEDTAVLDFDGDGLAGDDVDFSDYGVIAQFGIFIPNTDWEPFVRYDVIFADDEDRDLGDGDDTFNTITGGINYYMYGHASKFTFDVLWFIDEAAQNALGGNANPGIGYLTDDDDNEISLRFQWQLLF